MRDQRGEGSQNAQKQIIIKAFKSLNLHKSVVYGMYTVCSYDIPQLYNMLVRYMYIQCICLVRRDRDTLTS